MYHIHSSYLINFCHQHTLEHYHRYIKMDFMLKRIHYLNSIVKTTYFIIKTAYFIINPYFNQVMFNIFNNLNRLINYFSYSKVLILVMVIKYFN